MIGSQSGQDPAQAGVPRTAKRSIYIYRHRLAVRLTHWVNAACLGVLLMSGLQIFNAHSALYWGKRSYFDKPLISMSAEQAADDSLVGKTQIGGHVFTTTGFLGASAGADGDLEPHGFPSWLTIPGHQDLATGRRWHFFFAWLFVLNGLVYLTYSVIAGHVRRDLIPSARQLRDIGKSILDHLLLRTPKDEQAHGYNVLQKLAYLIVIFILLPLMILTGLTMSPGMDAFAPGLLDLFGGRQSARTLHFLTASALVLFFFIHIVMVFVAGFWNEIRSMITGRYVIPTEPS